MEPCGIIVVNPDVPAPNNWGWLLKETTTKAGLDNALSSYMSPDGMVLLFQADRISNGKVVAKGIYRIPLTGGTVSTIREESATSTGMGVRRWTW